MRKYRKNNGDIKNNYLNICATNSNYVNLRHLSERYNIWNLNHILKHNQDKVYESLLTSSSNTTKITFNKSEIFIGKKLILRSHQRCRYLRILAPEWLASLRMIKGYFSILWYWFNNLPIEELREALQVVIDGLDQR